MKQIIGCLAFLGYVLNTIFFTVPLVIFALLKLIPLSFSQKILSYLIDGCATCWVKVNTFNQLLLSPLKINVVDTPELSKEQWYIVVSNHQSWVDILVLQRVFNQQIPFLKFFLKQQLLYVPVIGLAWWGLDFPFMKRYSKEFVTNNPHLKGKDIETTKKACQKFKHKPVSIMNFVEGTRFTAQKATDQQSPHSELLPPKAGGLSFAINAMDGVIDTILDVTIYYPEGIPSFWQFICGDVTNIKVDIKSQNISRDMVGDYQNDPQFKQSFQGWLNQLWEAKVATLEELKKPL
jgi:1-acyl-sn-glycerol-3-phosphate acyltransferase